MSLAVGVVVVGLAGCGAPQKGTVPVSSSGAPSSTDCTKDSMQLVTPGKFTVGTERPAREPWFVAGDPKNGEGYESALAYAVAERLGFSETGITWVAVPSKQPVGGGRANYDVVIDQRSIVQGARKLVDFSSPYYDVPQAVVTYRGSPIANVSTVAGLRRVRLGVHAGSAAAQAIEQQIRPAVAPRAFPTRAAAVKALATRQVEGLVMDLPSAFQLSGKQSTNVGVVGQLPIGRGTSHQFGVVLPKDSSITHCVSRAVDSLRADGTLASLRTTWLEGARAPLLK